MIRRTTTMGGWRTAALAAALLVGGCEDDEIFVPDGGEPAAPRALDGYYFDRAVYLTWELAPDWDGESFRVYGKRVSDADYFLIAEVTNCAGGFCSYTDVNVVPGVTYEYYVAAVDPDSGLEAASEFAVEVLVPHPTPPPVPGSPFVVALDGANYLTWDAAARSAEDFSHYRVYLADPDGDFLLGETDSEGFVDLLAANGETSMYVVSSVDTDGHESGTSATAFGTPRPDFHGELLYAFGDVPEASGFRFRDSEATDPVLPGTDPERHFRLEVDGSGWWLVPGPGTAIHPQGEFTTALKCGVAADASCIDWTAAPASGYVQEAVRLDPELTYMLEVIGDDGEVHYAAIRVALVGFDQNDDALAIFDWAYQLQPGNRNLAPEG